MIPLTLCLVTFERVCIILEKKQPYNVIHRLFVGSVITLCGTFLEYYVAPALGSNLQYANLFCKFKQII